MSLMAQIKDGQVITQTASSTSIGNADKENKSGINSDAFLQLLVAEMQNQDPLEPTSNTEWISQYATFTQVSEIQEIGDNMSNLSAQDLVGEYVIMKVTDEKGNTDYVSGKVDYTTFEDGDAFLSINGSLYSVKDLDTVANPQYMEAYNIASSIADTLKKLPSVNNITLSNEKTINELSETVSKMDDYQRSFLDKSVFEKIDEYVAAMKHLKSRTSSDGQSNSEGNDKTE